MTITPTKLFSDRAGHYAEHRPGYPEGVFEVLRQYVPVPADAADIGAGTGIFSRGLLRCGYRTISVEPNVAMRAEAMKAVADPDYRVIEGSGEATALDSTSTDIITVTQAFHWLDRDAALAEFRRNGRLSCFTAIVWNARQFEASAFMREYREMLLTYAPKYQAMKVFWKDLDTRVSNFFPVDRAHYLFTNTQRVDREAMLGNLFSTSYVPQQGMTGHEEIVVEANRLFDVHQIDGTVGFALETQLYIGRLC